MTDRSTFDPFEQRLAAEFERYVQRAIDPTPISTIADAAMRPRGLVVRARTLSRSRRFLLLGIAAALLVPATYLAASGLRPPTPDLGNRLPPLFGPARNGMIVAGINNDIVAIDPTTGIRTVILGGPEIDSTPVFSALGTQILFTREASGPALFIADADGSNARQLVSGKTPHGWFDLTADGRRLISTLYAGKSSGAGPASNLGTWILDIATGTMTEGLSGMDPMGVKWRPGHDQYVFESDSSGRRGFYVASTDGSAARAIAFPDGGAMEFQVSPDGSTIVYVEGKTVDVQMDGATYAEDVRGPLHTLDIDTGQDRLLTQPGDGYAWSGPQFSPDGTQIVAERDPATASGDLVTGVATQLRYDLFLLPVDGAGPAVELGPRLFGNSPADNARLLFSPDGKSVLAETQFEGTSWIFDTAGGPDRKLGWSFASGSTWQRLAP
jgi:Tol biopolymer transport system component